MRGGKAALLCDGLDLEQRAYGQLGMPEQSGEGQHNKRYSECRYQNSNSTHRIISPKKNMKFKNNLLVMSHMNLKPQFL